MRTPLLGAFAVALIVGCGEAPPADTPVDDGGSPSRDLFAGLPVFPGSRIAAGSATAAEARVSVAVSADSVAGYYRQALIDRDWEIRGDATASDGVVMLHAASTEGRPIWIRITPAGPDSCEVGFIAAVPDSARS